jgi:hypothetical protein
MRLEQGVSSSHATSEGLALGRGCEVASSMGGPSRSGGGQLGRQGSCGAWRGHGEMEAYLHPICNLDTSIVIVVVSL